METAQRHSKAPMQSVEALLTQTEFGVRRLYYCRIRDFAAAARSARWEQLTSGEFRAPFGKPGLYETLAKQGVAITGHAEFSDGEKGLTVLWAGRQVRIVEVMRLEDIGRLRGRITEGPSHPAGWVSMEKLEDGYKWVGPVGRSLTDAQRAELEAFVGTQRTGMLAVYFRKFCRMVAFRRERRKRRGQVQAAEKLLRGTSNGRRRVHFEALRRYSVLRRCWREEEAQRAAWERKQREHDRQHFVKFFGLTKNIRVMNLVESGLGAQTHERNGVKDGEDLMWILPQLQRVEVVLLHNNPALGDRTVAAFVAAIDRHAAVRNRIVFLGLDRTGAGDAAAEAVAALLRARLPALVGVSLQGNSVSNTGARKLAACLGHAPRLKELQLGTNRIGHEGQLLLKQAWEKAGKTPLDGMDRKYLEAGGCHGLSVGDQAPGEVLPRARSGSRLRSTSTLGASVGRGGSVLARADSGRRPPDSALAPGSASVRSASGRSLGGAGSASMRSVPADMPSRRQRSVSAVSSVSGLEHLWDTSE